MASREEADLVPMEVEVGGEDNDLQAQVNLALQMGDMLEMAGVEGKRVYHFTMKGIVRNIHTRLGAFLEEADTTDAEISAADLETLAGLCKRTGQVLAIQARAVKAKEDGNTNTKAPGR